MMIVLITSLVLIVISFLLMSALMYTDNLGMQKILLLAMMLSGCAGSIFFVIFVVVVPLQLLGVL